MHHFNKSLKKGQEGEARFQELWPHLKRTDGRKHDFISPDGWSLELKTDSYDMNRTKNFFIEVWSNFEMKKVGGPQQALNNDTTFWAYFFPKNDTVFIFRTAALVAWLEDECPEYKLIEIKNPKYTTMGILVPRESVAHLYYEWKAGDEPVIK